MKWPLVFSWVGCSAPAPARVRRRSSKCESDTPMSNQNRKHQKTASKPAVVKAPIVAEAPAPAPVVVEMPAPAPVVAEPVAPVVTDVPAPAAAPKKEVWEDTMKKAQASFAKTGTFREGTNRFVLYPLLNRDEGMSLNEAVEAIEKAGRVRKLSTVQTDLHDIAKITQRKLIRCDKGDLKRYKLAPVAPVAPVAEEVKA
jgi:hypothetical protein